MVCAARFLIHQTIASHTIGASRVKGNQLNIYETVQPSDNDPMSSAGTPVHHQFANVNSMHNLIRVLSRRSKWIIGPIVICVLSSLIITLLTKPTYEATTTIELNKSSSGSLDLGIGDALSGGLLDDSESLQTDLQTETAILKGDSLALAVIKKLGLVTQEPFAVKERSVEEISEQGLPLEQAPLTRTRLLKTFESLLKVQPVHGTRLILVTYESHDAKQAAQIANALIDSYKNQYLQTHYDATSEASEWLTKQLSELKTNVEDSEKKLTDYEKESGILSLDTLTSEGTGSGAGSGGIHSVVIQKLDALNAELTAAEANRIEKEAIYHLALTGNEDVVVGLGDDPLARQSNSLVLTQGGGISNLQGLRQQRSQLKISLADASATYGANNRHLKEIQTQMSALEEQIHQELQEITKRAQGDFQLAKQTEDAIRRQFDGQQAEASKLNEKAVQFAVLSQEAFSRKKLYEDLYTKLQEANVSAGIKATNITIVDPARSQAVPIRPKKVSNLALGFLFGIFIGLAAAYIVDSFDRTMRDPGEVEEITGIPVIGIIPSFEESVAPYGARRIKGKSKEAAEATPVRNTVWMLTHPESAAAEAFRALRTSIMLSRTGGGPKVILVTSCIPGEGKTTISSNLAVAFAQHDKKVIIVEADMRRPRMKHAFDVSNKIGLCNVLAGSHTSEEAILHGVHVPTLDVLPAGPHPPMPSEMLGSKAFDELLQQLRSRYDIVLVDSPPALLVTDAVSISSKSDATIWVSQAGTVTRPQLARAADLIERNGMPVIGFVVNRMSRKVAGYGYGYGYKYDNYGSYSEEKNSDEA
jgi:capsular exopolysaccharide synthesis family protein